MAPNRPNAGLEAMYRRALLRWIDAMNASVFYWVERCYRGNPPRIAQDETPADVLRRTIKRLGRQWQKKFNQLAPELAEYFSKAMQERSDTQLRAILRRGGFSVRFQMTPPMRDILDATIHEQVSLIKSIPQEYLKKRGGCCHAWHTDRA